MKGNAFNKGKMQRKEWGFRNQDWRRKNQEAPLILYTLGMQAKRPVVKALDGCGGAAEQRYILRRSIGLMRRTTTSHSSFLIFAHRLSDKARYSSFVFYCRQTIALFLTRYDKMKRKCIFTNRG